MKDNFSTQSEQYSKYRPGYPLDFFEYINSIVQSKQNAWDCGTGNGQVAGELAKTFEKVYATDISQSQINNGRQVANILYSVQPAEKTNFSNNSFDLIIVAQAVHWFDFEKFYTEVSRTAKNDALLCVVGYNRPKISPPVDTLITNFYENVIGKYWDKERKYVDENYKTIPFPFVKILTPNFTNKVCWTLDHFIGYLNTWSAVKRFIQQNGQNPVDKLRSELEQNWGKGQTLEVNFPLLLRIGQIVK